MIKNYHLMRCEAVCELGEMMGRDEMVDEMVDEMRWWVRRDDIYFLITISSSTISSTIS